MRWLHECGEAGGAPQCGHELGRLPEHDPVGRQPTVHLRFPEPVAVDLAHGLEPRPDVAGVVAGKVVALSGRKRRHVARVAAEVLRPVDEPKVSSGLDGAGERLVPPPSSRIVAIQSGAGIICAIVSATISPGRAVDPVPPVLRHELVGREREVGPREAIAQFGRARPPFLHEHLDAVALRLERLQTSGERLRRRVRPDHDRNRRLAPCIHDGSLSSERGRRPAARPRARPPRGRPLPCSPTTRRSPYPLRG